MSHSLDQNEFRALYSLRRRSPAADIAHAVGDAVDHEGRQLEMPETFGSITGGDGRDGLASAADWIEGAIEGAARSRSDFFFIARIPR